MKLYSLADKLLERIEFSNKTKILITIIALSMMTIGFLMMISIFALKYDYETLFQKRTITQMGLEEIKDIYTVNIYNTLYDIKEGSIDIENASEVISLAKQIVDEQWQHYNDSIDYEIGGLPEFASNWLKFFLLRESLPQKSYYQRGLVAKIDKKIAKINKQSGRLFHLLSQNSYLEKDRFIDELFLEINSINIYLSSLTTSHIKETIAEKERNDRLFTKNIYMLFLLIGLVFFLSLLISLILTNNFKVLNRSLEKKVNSKTKELMALNDSLEQKIKIEVHNSRKKDQIISTQARLASMGEMLQNIAHQWRQPLGALMMIVQSFQSKFYCGKLNEEFIESRVEDAGVLARNMSDTLEDFRTFFDPNKSRRNFCVKSVIEKSIDLTKYQLEKENIKLFFEKSESVKMYGFENELIQVILNLINNSKDALCENKIVEKYIKIIVKSTNSSVIIKVIDNAGGIKSDIMAKVFDPYFTTKHKSVGTGIGLYMSKQMVEKHMNGKISCKNIQHKMKNSELSNCAMFTVKIPKIGE